MIIYEVKLELIDKTIYSSFLIWLKSHVSQMLKFKGFKKADMIDSFNKDQTITIKYHVHSEDYLNNYINNYSKQMRSEGMLLFKNTFKASRKIYQSQ